MATLSQLCSPNTNIRRSSLSLSFASSSTHLRQWFPRRSGVAHGTIPTTTITCKAGESSSSDNNTPAVDRRNVLLGLGGLYGASTLVGLDGKALANPVEAPDVTKCHTAKVPDGSEYSKNCCPPYAGEEIIDYKLPPVSKLRVRGPAHTISPENLEKYKEAVRRMKALPDDDPRSFSQQAKVHCAYCNFGYDQIGFPGLELQVHSSWIFFPFHRWYLYFYERILGKLIDDETFAMPFWNWDHPDGMTMPAIFVDKDSPLYDAKRDPNHLPPVIVDYDIQDDSPFTDAEQIENNLAIMYKQMVSGAKTPELFFGKKYVAGASKNPGPGTIESRPHNTIHLWSGNPGVSRGEDMGQLYSAGYDSMFFCHHMNVDRMWTLWKKIGKKRKDIKDPEYLEASFLFFDENKRLVRVKVEDSLNTERMGYKYQEADLPWLKRKGPPKFFKPKATVKITKEPSFPLVLKSPISATVRRPKKSRSTEEKEKDEEVLVVQGIQLDRSLKAKFDVYINEPDSESVGVGAPELAGSFVNVPQKANEQEPDVKTDLLLGITDLLEEIKADDDDSIVVTIVPRKGRNKIKIEGLAIHFSAA